MRLAALCFLLLHTALGAAEITSLSNKQLQVSFDARTGGLSALTDSQSGHNFASATASTSALWTLEVTSAGTTKTLKPSDAGKFECRSVSGVRQALQLVWSDFGTNGAPGLRVEAMVRLDPVNPISRWELAVTKPRDCAIERVQFPCLSDLPPQTNEFLAVPAWMGEMLPNPRAKLAGVKGRGARYSWEYPGTLSLQCMAFYQLNGPGLYLACDDAAAFRKNFTVRGDGHGGIAFEISHLPENRALGAVRYSPAYGVILGTFKGDWITAAERYRAWATQQVWARQSRLHRGLVPEWALKTALWVWNRGRSGGVLQPAEAIQRELGLPVSVLWHWWHGCSYDAGFPEYLPPREGADPCRAALAHAHKSDVHALVYMNQRLWGMTTQSWKDEGAERFTVRAADGTFRQEVYNTFTKQPCVSMCMGTGFWRNKYAGLAERAVKELAVDGIYMDQACSSLSCFDPAHGHPLGGGTYWMKGFRKLSTDIRARCRAARPIALAGEGCGEPWLPFLDLMLSLEVSRERYAAPTVGWETIPFFQAVYHPYAIQFGNYSSLTMPPYDDLWPAEFAPKEPLKLLDQKHSRQFCLEQARAFVWGQQPTVANFQSSHLRDRPEEVAYALRLARIRQHGLKYLLRGEFLRPPDLDAPQMMTDMSRLSIYAGQRGGLTEFQKLLPSALAGAWRAPDGSVAIALASISEQPTHLTLRLDKDYYGLSKRKRVYQIDESGRKPMCQLGDDHSLKVSLPARGACLLEFTAQ
ncbi:MAG: hypothetical protein HZA88_09085 [Verrucomicrobia bacterium]|nr:hypothetical protein [Verrucomicrobiota bacterium]